MLFYFKYNEEFDPFYEYNSAIDYSSTNYYNNNLFINLALKHNLTDIIDIYVNDYNIDLEDILNYFPRNPNDSEKVQIQNIKKYIDGNVDEDKLRKFKNIIDSGDLVELQGYIDNPIIKLNVDENYALNKMIANNNIEGVKMLLEDDSVNPNSRHYDGLFEAFRNNSYSIIRLLINDPRFTVDKVLDVLEKYHKIRDIFNTNDMYNFLKIEEFINDNNLDLYQAIVTHNSTDMEKILKINIPTQDLKTIITKYSNGGKIPLFELIINNPNYDQQELLRILRQLYISNNTNLIKFLLFNDGYNKAIYSKILIEAIKNQTNELTFMLLNYPSIDVNYNKEIALWYAVKNKDKDIVVKLLELGANPDNMNSLDKNYTNRRVIDALLNDEGLETKNINKTQEKFSEVKNMEDSIEDVIEKFSFKKALKKYPVGQQRTSNGKQFVFLLDNYAIKGPYNGKGLDKYNNVRARSKQFKKWNTPLILHPLKFFSDEDGSWIVYENIDRGELEVHKHTESFGDKLTYNIAERKKYQKMNEALSEKMFWPYAVSEQLIKALIHMYILNTGDTGLANILVSRRVPKKSIDYKLVKELGLIYFIDYEENRSSDRDDAEFYFSKPSAAKYEWYENTKGVYNKVADSLDNLEVPKEYKDRVKRAQKLLRKYGVESKKTKNPEPEPDTDSDSEPVKKPISKKSVKEPISKKSVKKPVEDPEGGPEPGGEKGKRLHIQRAVSRNGIQTSVLVSALQKYIRRDIDFDACKAAFELYAFRTNPQAKGIITMLYNRLAIIAAEDIGPANFSLVYNVLLSSKDRNMSPYDLCNMVIEMCQSKKTRIMSWYKYAYGTKDGREKARKAGYEFPENYTDEQVTQIKKEAKRYNLDKYIGVKEKAPKAERNLEHAIEWAIMYKIMLEKRDTLAFFYLGLFNELAYPNKVPDKHSIKVSQISLGDKSTTDVKVVLWYLIKELFPKKIFDIFLHWNYQTDKNKSNMVFLYVLTTAYIYNEDLSKVKQEDYSKNFFPYNVSNMFIPLVNGNYTMKIPDYVLDKHTGAKGKGIKEFVTEGALVTNQDPRYYDKKLEALYMGKE